jgi:hypothetical protein
MLACFVGYDYLLFLMNDGHALPFAAFFPLLLSVHHTVV